MSVPDPFDALTAYLRSQAGVRELASQRVYPRELPADEACAMPRAAVVLVPAGGLGGNHTVSLQTPRCDVTCYGETPAATYQLYLAVWGALRALRRTVCAQTLLQSAIQSGGPIQGRDTDTHWPFVWSSWTVFAGTVPVSED